MATWTPDPTFYPSARLASRAPVEKLSYVAEFDPTRRRPDRLAVVDLDPGSTTYTRIVGRVEMPTPGDELPHLERRFLVVPGLRSSRIHILDTKPDPKQPKIVRVIEPSEVADRAGYSR